MTRLLDEALAAVFRMPDRDQDAIARGILTMARTLSERPSEVVPDRMAEPFRLWPRRRAGAVKER